MILSGTKSFILPSTVSPVNSYWQQRSVQEPPEYTVVVEMIRIILNWSFGPLVQIISKRWTNPIIKWLNTVRLPPKSSKPFVITPEFALRCLFLCRYASLWLLNVFRIGPFEAGAPSASGRIWRRHICGLL